MDVDIDVDIDVDVDIDIDTSSSGLKLGSVTCKEQGHNTDNDSSVS